MTPEHLVWAFVVAILLLTIGTWFHAKSIDPPLENEEYLAENPELRELKEDDE